jgi:hypothetical protein
MPEKKDPVALVTPTQEDANAFKARAVLNRDARAEDDELPPPVEHDPPTPTQDEANEIKVQTALGGIDITAPVNVDVPSVQPESGAHPGDSLTCTMGNWQMQPSDYSYQWFRDTEAVGSGPSYAVTEADAGHSIHCVVTATNAIGATTAPASNAVSITPAARAAGPAATTRK